MPLRLWASGLGMEVLDTLAFCVNYAKHSYSAMIQSFV
jgi:hypothetical protein